MKELGARKQNAEESKTTEESKTAEESRNAKARSYGRLKIERFHAAVADKPGTAD